MPMATGPERVLPENAPSGAPTSGPLRHARTAVMATGTNTRALRRPRLSLDIERYLFLADEFLEMSGGLESEEPHQGTEHKDG